MAVLQLDLALRRHVLGQQHDGGLRLVDVAQPHRAEPALTITEDPSLPPGDAAAAWRGGGATLSLAARRRAVAALLHAFDLQET